MVDHGRGSQRVLLVAEDPTERASREVTTSRILICEAARGSLGSPRLHLPGDFSSRRMLLSLRRPSATFYSSGFNCPLGHSPTEFLRLHTSPHCSRKSNEHTCLDFCPPRGFTRARPHSCEDSQSPHTFRPQVFATSRRFSPHSRSRAYFIPLPRPGPSRSGSSPLPQPPLLVGESLPPCRYSRRPHHRSDVRAPRPRLRGFDLRERALLRASIIHRHPCSLPSSGFSLPGLLFSSCNRFTRLLHS